MRRRVKLITILFFAGTSLSAQDNLTQEAIDRMIHPVGVLKTDTISVELTQVYKQEILALETREKNLEEQYKAMKQAIAVERSRLLVFVADKKNIRAEDIITVLPGKDIIAFVVKHYLPANASQPAISEPKE